MAEYDIRMNGRENDIQFKVRKITECDACEENKRLVIAYDRENALNGKKTATRYSYLGTLHFFCKFAGQRPFRALAKEDIVEFLGRVKYRGFQEDGYRARVKARAKTELSTSTLNLHKHVLKKFVRYVHGATDSYPECVAWIRVKANCGKEKTAEELLTQQEVEAIIASTESPRDRALVSLMAESGARLGEIITARIRNVLFNDRGFSLSVNGKTGTRTIPLCASEQDLKEWLNSYHPYKGDPEAPLFTSYAEKRNRTNLKEEGVGELIRKAAARAGISKRVYPHLFRHTRATELARLGWTEPMLKKFFGWDKNSRMPSVYVHLAETDVEDKYYEMYGRGEKKTAVASPADRVLTCPSCQQRNPTGYVFCFRCNHPLKEEAKSRVKAESILDLIVADPQLRKQFDDLLEKAHEKEQASRG